MSVATMAEIMSSWGFLWPGFAVLNVMTGYKAAVQEGFKT